MTDIPLLDAPARLAIAPPHDLDAVARVAKALGDPKRLRVLGWLARGEQCVCDLCDCCGMSQPLLSFHLRVLKEAGLVADRRDGRWVHYRLAPGGAAGVQALLGQLEEAAVTPGDGIACC